MSEYPHTKPREGELFWRPTSVDPNVRPQDRARLGRQCEQLLTMLRGGAWVSERDVYPDIKRLAARIYDLREHGYKIEDRWAGPVKQYRIVEGSNAQ